MYEYVGGRRQGAMTCGDVHSTCDADPLDLLPSVDDFRFRPLMFPDQFNAERRGNVGEDTCRSSRLDDIKIGSIDPGPPANCFLGIKYCLQGTYRFTSRFTGLLRYDVSHQDKDNRDGDCLAETKLELPDHICIAKDCTVGLSWTITPDIMVRTEYPKVDGTRWLTRLDNSDPSETKKHWNRFAVQAAFRF